MYGAILGDIIGSPFEFDRGDKTKDFELFSGDCGFTDDSVMTIAVAEALLAVGQDAGVPEIKEAVAMAVNGQHPAVGVRGGGKASSILSQGQRFSADIQAGIIQKQFIHHAQR